MTDYKARLKECENKFLKCFLEYSIVSNKSNRMKGYETIYNKGNPDNLNDVFVKIGPN